MRSDARRSQPRARFSTTVPLEVHPGAHRREPVVEGPGLAAGTLLDCLAFTERRNSPCDTLRSV
jgi:hypothetical protein